MSGQFLEQWINIKFCVILGKKMQVTLVQCSPRLMGEKLWKSHVSSEWYKQIKEGYKNMDDVEITKTMLITFFNLRGRIMWK